LDAVLGIAEGPEDNDRCERAPKAARETAALVHPEAIIVGSSRIAARFKQRGVSGLLPQGKRI